MIKLMCGKNGTGKTKYLVDSANNFASLDLGHVVYVDSSNNLLLTLNHKIRFINVTEFPISVASEFIGFISGIISEDYDIKFILIDSLEDIISNCQPEIKKVLEALQNLSQKFDIEFHIGLKDELEDTDQYKKEFVA